MTSFSFCVCFILYIAAVEEQRAASATVVGSTVGDSSPPDVMLPKDKSEPLGLNIQQIPLDDGASFPDMNSTPKEGTFQLEDDVNVGPNIEHQFISSFNRRSPLHRECGRERPLSENLSALRNGSEEDLSFSLQLGDNEPPKRRRSEPPPSAEEPI